MQRYSKSKETINYWEAMILLIVIVHCYSSASVNAFVKKAIMEKTTTKTRISFFFFLGQTNYHRQEEKSFKTKEIAKQIRKRKCRHISCGGNIDVAPVWLLLYCCCVKQTCAGKTGCSYSWQVCFGNTGSTCCCALVFFIKRLFVFHDTCVLRDHSSLKK